jgi:hypothetical protein
VVVTNIYTEPAQAAVYKAGLNPELISMISNPSRLEIANAVMGIISKLLGLVANQGKFLYTDSVHHGSLII